MYRIVLAFLLCVFSLSTSLANENAINVTENEYVYGGTKISKYSGDLDSWNKEAIISELDNFEPFTSDFNSGLPNDDVSWIYFDLLNPDALDLWINFGSAKLNTIKIFELDDNLNVIDSLKSGLDEDEDYRFLNSYKFCMPIMKGEQKEGKFLVGYYSKGGLQDTYICFGSKIQMVKENQASYTYTLLFSGVFLILFLYNLALAKSLKDKIYLFYSLNLISLFIAFTYSVNYPFLSVVFGESFTQDYMAAWICLMPFTMTIFTVHLFDLKKTAPGLYRILNIGLGFNVLVAISTFILPLYVSSFLAMFVVVSFFMICTYVGYDQMRKKHSLAFLYLSSWVVVMVGIILYLMVQLGLFYNEACHYANYIASSLEVLLYSIALGKRYQLIMEEQKETAELLEKKNETLVLANDALDSFNYHVSHDLKTIMVNSGSLNQMIKKYTLSGKTEKVIQISDRLDGVVKKGEETIKGFLSLAEAAGEAKKERESIGIVSVLNDLIESNGLQDVSIIYDKLEFNTILFNPVEFNSVFLNLLTNSKKYTTKKPEVKISTKLGSNDIQIVYEDIGIGFDLALDED
jgi:signal transduction histidine kinase